MDTSQKVLLSSGEMVALSTLFDSDHLVLVFLRHFGCIFCRENVAAHREKPDLNVVFVSMGSPEEAEAFRAKMNSPHRYICDPKAKLYREMRLQEGTVGQFLGPNVVKAGMSAMMKGHGFGRPVGNPKMLSGTFILDRDGRVVWEHRDKDAGAFARVEEIERGLAEMKV